MGFEKIIFYVLFAITFFSSLGVITARNPVYSVLYLVLTFFTVAMVWVMLEAEFLGIVLVLVYVGAVMVLFIFVVMMLDINLVPLREGFTRYLPVGLFVAMVMIAEMIVVVGPGNFGSDKYQALKHTAEYSNTEELGSVLYTVYVYPFEIASVILLVAIVAAISLTLRKRPENKTIDPAEQIKVKRQERIRMVKMDAENK